MEISARRPLPLTRNDFQAAQFLIDEFGVEAELYAALRIDALAEQDDHSGVLNWRCILQALEILQRTSASGETVQ